MDGMFRELEASKQHWEEASQRPGDIRVSLELGAASDGLSRIAIRLMTDQQIRDNVALFIADHDYVMAQFDLEERVYLPPLQGERRPSLELGIDQPVLAGFYFLPFKFLTNWREENYPISTLPARAIYAQSMTDYARLAAALESQYRAIGHYPDALDALSRSFPDGMPHDVATGQPYFYDRAPDDTYKLWGTGIDQTNNNGDAKKDILFVSPPSVAGTRSRAHAGEPTLGLASP